MTTTTMYRAEGNGPIKKMVAVQVDESKITDALQAQMIAEGTVFVDNLLQEQAAALGYGDIISACSYAAYPNPYQKEGQQYVAWRGAVWSTLYSFMEAVKAGTKTYQGVSQLPSIMPAFSSFAVA